VIGFSQKFQNDILVILNCPFHIGDANIFIRLMGKLRLAGPKYYNWHTQRSKMRPVRSKTNSFGFTCPYSRAKIPDKITIAVRF